MSFYRFWGQTAVEEHKPLIIQQGDRTPLLSASLSKLTNSHTYTCVSTCLHQTSSSHFTDKKNNNFFIVVFLFLEILSFPPLSPETCTSTCGDPLHYIPFICFKMPVPHFFLRTFPGFHKIVPNFAKEEKLLLGVFGAEHKNSQWRLWFRTVYIVVYCVKKTIFLFIYHFLPFIKTSKS